MAAAAVEPQLEHELQQEVSGITIQGYISNLHRQFETKLCDNRNHIITLSKNWNDNVSEIAALRDELNNIVAAASDPGVKDDGEPPAVAQTNEALHYIPDFSLLKHMGGDEINGFLKTEWLKLRREHKCEMQKKTEELFRLKRAKDGAALPLRKERELESIKSKLLQTISKMDGIVSRKEGLNNCFDYDEDGELCRLKDRIASLLDENERLRGLLADKRKDAKELCLQVAGHSLSESKLSNQIQKLCGELDDLKIESHLKDLLELSVLREVFGNYEKQIDDGNQEE